jgi:hypothetical protein
VASGNLPLLHRSTAADIVYIPPEEYTALYHDFLQQIAYLFTFMKTLDTRGFLFRLDFNNYLSNQIMELQQQQQQQQQMGMAGTSSAFGGLASAGGGSLAGSVNLGASFSRR